MSTNWRTAWVTGASTGIGREVALALAGRGVKVAASARSADTLAALAAEHPLIVPFPLDVTDRGAVTATAKSIEQSLGPVDLAVLSAGIWQPSSVQRFDAGVSAQSMSVNYLGIAHVIEALLPAMIARRGGHLALVSSVAGYRGMPKAAAYGPSKAAVISLAEVLKTECDRHGVAVSVVNPGFVATPMTQVNTFPMPFMVSAKHAADRILGGLEKRRFEIAFPWQLVALLKLARLMPYPLYFWFARTFLVQRRRDRPQ